MALVYLATNVVNNHKYVGYTSRTLAERKREHLCAASRERPDMVIAKAIKKYGKDNFLFEILESGLPTEQALQREIELISKIKPEYNISSGGDIGSAKLRSRPVKCLTDGSVHPSGIAAGISGKMILRGQL